MDQKGCQYVPHVMGIMVGQPFKVLNSDGILHNVHALPKVNRRSTWRCRRRARRPTETFGKEEGMFMVKCDVHPWMQSYVGVFANPFFAVTGDGRQVHDRQPARRAPTRSRPGTRSSARRRRR